MQQPTAEPAQDRTFTAADVPHYDEDLRAMAAQAYRLADTSCEQCQNFHALWPYRRLARMCGAEGGLDVIDRTLAGLIAAGARRVLIAGAADTNLLATVARAAAGHAVEVKLIDRCATPVELSRRFAQRWSLSLTTEVGDLLHLDATNFDIVYANSVLWYFPEASRIDVLSRFRRALNPGGHFAHVFNTSGRIAGDAMTNYRNGYADWVIAELDRQKIQLPDTREVFRRRMDDCARGFATNREGTFGDPDAVNALLRAAGFEIKSREELELPLASPLQKFVATLSKRRFLTIAQSPQA